MKTLVEMKFGSHLYGTATPQSDLDIKAVYLPDARDILLQRVKPSVNIVREKSRGEKNTAEDIDFEAYSPAKFLDLLAEGQTVALDMLFAPADMMLSTPDPVWSEIKALAPRLFSRKTTAFVSYCRQQARKYGVKGARLAAVRLALDGLTAIEDSYGANTKLGVAEAEIRDLAASHDLLDIVVLPHPDGNPATYFDVAGKKAIFSASIKGARTMVQNLFDEFGARTRAAEDNQGVDWKAMTHAVRIADQAIEFLDTRQITFPRPNAAHLLAIKRGEIPYASVAEEIENLLTEVEMAVARTTLPETVDRDQIDDFIVDLHQQIVSG
ncbi:DNA polymerase beta superfamily protein [Asticcacaulis sp. AC402]|uniref:DNA polymerase beta superfamily protein n=1 Tax=Asticcacaulis sp. AC402 TaxID=1282361 RepID=UPI0004CE56BA|nr:nucleotidyltransferase domain-containing protein [Asticcacaulis sp. AC402]